MREAVAPLHMEIFMLSLREVVFDEEVGPNPNPNPNPNPVSYTHLTLPTKA